MTVSAHNVVKTFGGRSVLTDVSFCVGEREVMAVLGQADSGKTTLLKILSGCIRMSSGSVSIGGIDLRRHPRAAKRFIGYMPEGTPVYPAVTAREYLSMLAELRGMNKKNAAKNADALADRFSLDGSAVIITLPPRSIRLLTLAGALAGDPQVVILDSPTQGADPDTTRLIRSCIADIGRQKCVIMTTTSLHEALSSATHVLALSDGRVSLCTSVESLRSSMAGSFRIRLRVVATVDMLFRMKDGIDEIMDMNILHTGDGNITDIEIETVRQTDVQQHIWRYSVDHDIPLLEMKNLGITEDDLYLRLSGHIKGGGFQ